MRLNSVPTLATAAFLLLTISAHAQNCGYSRRDFHGDDDWESFGWSVSGAGDVNNDGFDDIVVGVPDDDGKTDGCGSARVFSGADGSILHTFFGDDDYESFGYAVSGAGDVNNDGYDDIIVAAPWDSTIASSAGEVRVFSGQDGATLHTFFGENESDRFGYSVSGAGDVNQDGHDDILVGTMWTDDNGSTTGKAWVFSGETGVTLYTFLGNNGGDSLGRSVSGAGDVNNDGYDDVILGAYRDDDNGANSGSARVHSGADGSILHTFIGDSSYDYFGRSVSGVGDVNHDGFDDVVVGAPREGAGSARVYSGADGTILFTFYGDPSSGNDFGDSVSGAGDVNNDGFNDIVVGFPSSFTDPGSVQVHSGADGSILYTLFGDGLANQIGGAVSGAGDVNGDGFDDIVLGTQTYYDPTPGSAVLVEFTPGHTTEYCTANNEASISSTGCSLDFAMSVILHADPLYMGQLGYLLISDGTDPITAPGAIGELCLGGGSLFKRYSLDVISIDGNGLAATSISNSVSGGPGFGIPYSGGQSIQLGDTWNFAYWYRLDTGESAFSSMLSIPFVQW